MPRHSVFLNRMSISALHRNLILILLVLYVTDLPAQTLPEDVSSLASERQSEIGGPLWRIKQAGKEAVPALIDGLKNNDPKVRLKCMHQLRELKDLRSLPGLIQALLTDGDFHVRREAVGAVTDYKNRDAAMALKKATQYDSDLFVREGALRGVSYIEGTASVPFLKKLLGDENLRIRLKVAQELGRHGDASGYELAMSNLNSRDSRISMYAAEALGLIADPRALPALGEVANDEARGLARHYAADAVRHIELLQMPESERLSHLQKTLKSSHGGESKWAAYELAQRKDPETIAVLKEVLSADPGSPGQGNAQRVLIKLLGKEEGARWAQSAFKTSSENPEYKLEQGIIKSLKRFRSAVSIYYVDKNNNFPRDAQVLVPNYISEIPSLSIPKHQETREVKVIAVVAGDAIQDHIHDTGGWLYFADPNSKLFGKVAIDCNHKTRSGLSWHGL